MWYSLASVILKKKSNILSYEFKRQFKIDAPLVEIIFKKLEENYSVNAKHLLWTLHYLKTSCSNESETATFLGTNVVTMRLYVDKTLRMLIASLPKV